MTLVLLAEDDASISEPLARALQREGYYVEVQQEGPGALAAARMRGVDLVVLDLGLPGMDGLEVCRRIRSDGLSFPVLVLTARADEVDTVVGLDAGADDYVTKPFKLAELLARVRALLRRGSTDAPENGGDGGGCQRGPDGCRVPSRVGAGRGDSAHRQGVRAAARLAARRRQGGDARAAHA